MKPLSHFRYAVLGLLFAVASGCSDEEKKQDADPKPTATSHTVQVQYKGANLTDLGARISGEAVSADGQTVLNNFSTLLPEQDIADVISVGEIPISYKFTTIISFENLRTTRAPLNSSLEAIILVDGVAKRTLRINHATAPGSSFVTAKAVIQPSDW
ncbi:hypothetical protein [Hymenobacter psychrotolerans]|uniref:Lipoprotein n=1 Tax=Hymenobacter psychrotolerans DSM 18569 TaxID=1121959 RepID=A0A1M7G7Z6_9BACT|nr:hypothetical protein [Hymenobacter psychrotolerans]SHM12255.1 hypothetical protein SAMN02746009_03978 [Hymenobacter psychrotolerans DSM 18569]